MKPKPPLYKEGAYKTFHLADDTFFRSLKRRPVITADSPAEAYAYAPK